jgi:phage shock protein PspC (stress-responsive transcriptional regulator)
MEKIININLGGRIIAIEDAAYTSLKAYFESLRRYFEGEEGRDEIISDIESRVAELMEEKIKRGAGAITEADVQEIINGIGRVEDFAAEEESARTNTGGSSAKARSHSSKRFFRDENDKIAGGVCSGIAAYLNVDPALVRIVFAILAFGGWGFGIVLYLILWIFVPAQPMEGYRGRRLFRDEEDKWLGGVASGLAVYFDKDPWIFRLIFASPFLLSLLTNGGWWILWPGSLFFGSIGGTFILIYIVLWVVLPVARSQFEKMEMRGEKVDLNSIRQNVAANMGDIKSRVKDWGDEVSQSASQFMNTRGREFSREVSSAMRTTAHRSGSVLGTIIKAFFLFIGITIAFSLFMVLITYSFGGFADLANGFIMQTTQLRVLGWFTVILLLGVPPVALVTFMARRALRIRTGGRYFGLGFMLLWIAGFVCAGFLANALVVEFHHQERITEEAPVLQPRGNRMILTVPGPEVTYSNSIPWMHGDIRGWDVSDDTMRCTSVGVVARLSPDSLYHVIVTRYSMGRNATDAGNRAGQIAYAVRNIPGSDSLLALDNGYSITRTQGYRAQNVDVEVQVPAGKKIRFDESVEEKLSGIHSIHRFTRRNYAYRNWKIDYQEDYDVLDWNPDVDYIMAADGRLVDATHPEDTLDTRSYSIRRSYGPASFRYRRTEHHSRRVSRRMDSLERAADAIDRQKDELEGQEED